MSAFNYLYFRNHAAILVNICNIYANQMVIKVQLIMMSLQQGFW